MPKTFKILVSIFKKLLTYSTYKIGDFRIVQKLREVVMCTRLLNLAAE